MSVSVEGVLRFSKSVLHLQSFPIFCAYISMVTLCGVWRKVAAPFSLRYVLIVYNFTCSCLSVYTLFGFIYGLYGADHVYSREPVPILTHVFGVYALSKCLELLDTVFMVLRHKMRQISFLHVYHHSSMILLSDYAYRHTPWPAIAPVLALNSMVHIVLYLYYGLTALDANTVPSWKRHLTELQILQFFIDFVYCGIGYVYHGFCVYGFIYGILMIYLFSDFYYHAYLRPRSKEAKASE